MPEDPIRVLSEALRGGSPAGPYTATYRETVGVIPGTPSSRTAEGSSVTMSWGNRVASRTIAVGRSDNARFWKCDDFFASLGSDFGAVAQRSVWNSSTMTTEYGGTRHAQTGEIDRTRSMRAEFDPSRAHLSAGMTPLRSLLDSSEAKSDGPIVEINDTNSVFRIEIGDSGLPWRIVESREGATASVLDIPAYRNVPGGGQIPGRVVRRNFDGRDREVGNRTYELLSVSTKVDPQDVIIEWKENARVEDFIQNRHLVMRGGKMVVEGRFSDRPTTGFPDWTVVAFVAIVIIGLIRSVRQSLRRKA